MRRAGRLLGVVPLVAPAAGVAYLSFRAGGFFPTAPAIVALVLAIALAARLAIATNPLAGVSPLLVVATVAFGLFAVWTLWSGSWGSAGRALLEYDRALGYLLALVLFGLLPYTPARLAWMVRTLAAAIAGVAIVALVGRLLPEIWAAPASSAQDRLSYPLTYWNALGLLCAIGVILLFHVASSATEPRVGRVLAAAALPVTCVALLLTFSRGSDGVAFLGLAVLVAAGRPRALVPALLAVAPPTIVAVLVAYHVNPLGFTDDRSPDAVSADHRTMLAVGLAALAAAALRALLLPLDTWVVARLEARTPWTARGRAIAGGAALAVVVVAALAIGLPGKVHNQYDRFVAGDVTTETDQRARLRDLGNNGRLDLWRVAVDGSSDARFKGLGAGTYQNLWYEDRPIALDATDAHSLYVEVLTELGVVGLVLLLVTLGALLTGVAARVRGPDRGAAAAVLAAGVAWAVHAGVDWDWEMPAVTLWLFALGGAALAAPAGAARLRAPRLPARALLVLGCLVLAITPLLVARSQLRLDDAARAFGAADCPATVREAQRSTAALDARAEPFALRGLCEVGLGLPQQAVADVQHAVNRDERNWELWYALAVVQGVTGVDPRPAALRARELNPREPIAQDIAAKLTGRSPARWKRVASALPLPPGL